MRSDTESCIFAKDSDFLFVFSPFFKDTGCLGPFSLKIIVVQELIIEVQEWL